MLGFPKERCQHETGSKWGRSPITPFSRPRFRLCESLCRENGVIGLRPHLERKRKLTLVAPTARGVTADRDKERGGGIRAPARVLQVQKMLKLHVRPDGVIHPEEVRRQIDAAAGSDIVVGKLGDYRVGILDREAIQAAEIARLGAAAQAH